MNRPCLLAALALVAALTGGCTGVPEGLAPVTGFELDRYLGRWHEIARLDHSFERGLVDVTAEYRRRPDGRVDVVNRGYVVYGQGGVPSRTRRLRGSSAPRRRWHGREQNNGECRIGAQTTGR